jgi:hypothetical protein
MGKSPDCAEIGRLAGSAAIAPAVTGDSLAAERLLVLMTVATANDLIRRELGTPDGAHDPFRCAGKHLLEKLICAKGFGVLVEYLGKDSVHAALDRLSDARACTRAWQDESAPPAAIRASLDDCHADEMLVHLAADPIDVVDEQIRNILRRLRMVENGRKLEYATDLAEFLYRNTREAYIDWTIAPVSPIIPNRELHRFPGVLTYAVPFHFSGSTRADQIVVGYRPTVYMVRHTALVFPLEWSRGRFGTGAEGSQRNAQRTSIGVGVAYITGTSLVGPKGSSLLGSLQLTAFTASKAWTQPEWSDDAHFGVEASAQILADRMRIATRWLPRADFHGTFFRRYTLLFGISDLSGLVYWTGRAVH